ncbi:hypothetical protein [Streptomyces sp. SID3343]|uniref:hypothetical protein n=1 Tax=Streptomyces sp. SID3343 TaxID=2690260 RepID=UPI00136A0118|nr:hypothetical protein [Streptomyces sp. SID3343]MYW03111.1 hypothetical protein [Streptomyces sp. SID3343]
MATLDGFGFPVRHSPGARERAVVVARRVERAAAWLTEQLDVRARTTLSVADAADWGTVATVPLYGTPQGSGDHLRVAADDGWFGADLYADIRPHLRPQTAAALRETYGEPPALRPYFDLVAVHELTHLFQDQSRPAYPGMWIAELHANLAMVGYAHDVEPELLPVLRAFTATVDDLPAEVTPVRELADMDRAFDHGAINFAWFHFGLTRAAEGLWASGGPDVLRGLYEHVRAGGGAEYPALAEVAAGWNQSAGAASSGISASSVRDAMPNLG